MMALDRFYPIVDDISWIARLVPLGVRLVQLRIKDCSETDIGRQLREARAICLSHGAQLVVNDYWRIAIEEGCDFIHLGQEDLDATDFTAFRKAGLKLGVSTHTHRELDRVLPLEPDYVALGPIFPTRLKPMRFAPQGLARIGEWKRLIGSIPLVAIGGLTVERGYCAMLAGADVVAVVTDVTRNWDPEKRAREWLAITRP
jgi:thiamine-phosphate pyrophosphorylase